MEKLNKTIRLRTTPGGNDKHLTLKLEQSFDFLEVLSLKISQEDLYTNFCANYGVVIGRVLANKGFGVPNAKVSVFIPISSEDEKNLLIKDLYPYISPERKDGVRYNLLLNRTTCNLNKAVGTFPDKETLLSNDLVIEVFEKYYKYTTKTNESGDYMLFGVPTGERLIHMDVDLSDAGLLSVRPYDLISQGAPLGFFDSSSEFKTSSNIDTLPQIKSTNQGVDVIPFWGDPENCQIGITRVDLDTNTDLVPTALFMGSIFSDSEKNSLSKRCNPRNDMGELGELRTGAGTIKFIRASKINPVEWVQNKKIEATELEFFDIKSGDLIDDDGTFAIPVPMNVGNVITNEVGDLVPSADPEIGLPTKAKYRMKMSFNEPPNNRKRRTANMIVPSLGSLHGGTKGYTSDDTTGGASEANIGGTEDQRFTDNIKDYKDVDKDFHQFEWKQLYTVANYIKKYKKGTSRWSFLGLKNTDANGAGNNPMPFNTAIKKADFIYALGSFFLKIGAMFMKFIILLIGLKFGFFFGINASFSIFGVPICIFKFFNVVIIQPFVWLGNIMGKFTNDEDGAYCVEEYGEEARGFALDCNGETTCICTNCDEGVCGDENGAPCSGDADCSGETCGSPESCTSVICVQKACGCPDDSSDPNSSCDGGGLICFKGFAIVPSEDNCEAMQLIKDWLCCRIIELAEKRNVIRRCLLDAWMVGSLYLFQYKYKSRLTKVNGEFVLKEKFCGPGADTFASNNYGKNQCCANDSQGALNNKCAKCLIRGGGSSDKSVSAIESYHRNKHNDSVMGSSNPSGLACGNGATDIDDNIYCNNYSSTKIVSLGRVEMCPDTLNEIENCINANDCVFDLYKQSPDFFTGTFFEDGWDPSFWSDNMGYSSYQDPVAVLKYLVGLEDCKVNGLFDRGQGCHENELKNKYYQWMKEISKIYTEVVTVQNSNAVDADVFLPGAPDVQDADEVSGYVFDDRLGQRFSPCGGNYTCNQPPLAWSGEDTQFRGPNNFIGPSLDHNASKNIPYYYFGLNGGKTAIEKLRKEFFVN